ncbi:MAG: HAD family hydrolase [Gemmataceae bacterium]|nr:HAD family hydrolase [Gemmataceae bacterium]
MPIRGVIFDMDGTLVSQELDFEAIRRDIGLPAGTPLLEAMAKMPPEQRAWAQAILDRHEQQAAEKARVFDGIPEFLHWLDRRQIRRGLLTRNSRRSVETVLKRVGLWFDPIVAREDGPPKPNPDGIWTICRAWGFPPAEVLMIGDYIFDIDAGRRAGTKTALVTHGRDWPFAALADCCFPNFLKLPDLIEEWFLADGVFGRV